jgi:hypothetical protein
MASARSTISTGEKAQLLPFNLGQRHVAAGALRQDLLAVAVQLPLPAAIRRGMDPHRPVGGPHSAELGRDGEHSWTKAVQQVILRYGDASSQLDLAVSA